MASPEQHRNAHRQPVRQPEGSLTGHARAIGEDASAARPDGIGGELALPNSRFTLT